MLRLSVFFPAVVTGIRHSAQPIFYRTFSHRRSHNLDSSLWKSLEELPTDESYKKKEYDRRREAIEDDDSDDEDVKVIEWNENTRPEDIMDGKDLEEYYRAARQYMHKDTSSTDKEQVQKLQEISQLLKVNLHDLPGYKTFFQDKNSISSGLSDSDEDKFGYFDSVLESHPELMREFALWNQKLDEVSRLNVKSMSDAEFRKRTACPNSILSVVDDQHKHLFQLSKSDFVKVSDTKPSSEVEQEEEKPAKKVDNSQKRVDMTHLQSRIANTFDIMFESMWKSNIPISIAYVSNSNMLRDIFVYLKFEEGLKEDDKKKISDLLENKKPLFSDLLKIVLKMPETPNLNFRFTK